VSAGYATIIMPPAPTSISVPANSSWNGSFTVSWNENSGGIMVTSYKVDLGDHDTETGTTNWVDGHCTSSTTSCTFSANQVSAGTYLVRVDACDSSICSAEVQAGSAVTVSYLSPPAAPSLTGPANTTGSISLNWSKPNTTTSFELYGAYQSRSTGAWSTASVIYSGSAQSYTDTIGVAKSHARYYVRACNQGGCGSDSNTITVAYNVLGGGGGGGGGSRQVTTQSTEAAPATDTSDSSTPAPSSSTPPAAGPGGLTVVEHQPVDLLPQIDPVPGYRITTFTLPPALPVPLFASNLGTDHDTLEALRRARLQRVGHVLNQASEQAMQAAANRRAEARFAMLAPSVSTAERAAWLKSQQAQLRANPDGPRYAPPAYIAYADAHVVPATGTPYRFTVQYVYDDASGGLAAVANADTGFIYWQADMDSGVAPVDAFGHLLAYTDGNLVSTVSSFDAATGAPTGISAGIGQAQTVQQLTYIWDGYGNLTQRQDANQTLSESFQYDSLNRLTQSSVTNPAATGPNLSLSYDPLGNITCKSDVVGHACAPGSTDYTYDPDHPHAVQSIAGLPGTYSYDADGNMTSGNNRTMTWSVDNLPTDIQGAGGSSRFAYGPDHQRYLQTQANGTDTTYIGGLYEIVSTNGGATLQYRHNIVADGQVIAVHTLDQSGNVSTSYLHYDHLGSVDAITDDTGAVAERMSFDAFGQRRDPSNWTDDLTSGDIASLKDNTDRGYTDQEQLDNVGLIHMNGRVYDPQIGRFISADPIMGGDRYAYVGNNPLARTDPSGYCWAGCFWQPSAPSNFLKNQSNATDLLLTGLPSANWAAVNHIHWETENNSNVQMAIALVAAYYTGGLASSSWGTGFWGSVGSGAVGGGTYSGSMAALNSETPGQVIGAAGEGAAYGAVGGAITYGTDTYFGKGYTSSIFSGALNGYAQTGTLRGAFLGGVSGLVPYDLGMSDAYNNNPWANFAIREGVAFIRGGIINGSLQGAEDEALYAAGTEAIGFGIGYASELYNGNTNAPMFYHGSWYFLGAEDYNGYLTIGNVTIGSANMTSWDYEHEGYHATSQSAFGRNYLPISLISVGLGEATYLTTGSRFAAFGEYAPLQPCSYSSQESGICN
jgi:RHS repeat-associated protein